jgi:hypothetical protein
MTDLAERRHRPSSNGPDLAWLTPERARFYAVSAMLVLIASAVGVLRTLKAGHAAGGGLAFGSDFSGFWGASHLVLSGHGTDAYMPALQKAAQIGIMPNGQYMPFFYPPPFLLVCAPFALLPFFWALALFIAASGTAYAAAIYLAAGSLWVVAAAIGFPAMLTNLIAGQNAMLTAAILCGGLTLMDSRPRLAGLLLGLMVFKPQLALAVPFALLISRRWTVLGFAALSGLAMIGLSTLAFGEHAWIQFLDSTRTSRLAMEDGSLGFGKLQSAFALARMIGLDNATAYLVQGVTATFALAALLWVEKKSASPAIERSVIVLASLLMTPYLMHYDQVILVFPLVWLFTEWSRESFPPWGKVILLAAYVSPIGYLAYSPAHLPLFCIFGLTIYLAWLASHEDRSALPRLAADARPQRETLEPC